MTGTDWKRRKMRMPHMPRACLQLGLGVVCCLGVGAGAFGASKAPTSANAARAAHATYAAAPTASQAQAWSRASIDSGHLSSLQNGARHYLQSCMACHSAAHVSYDRLQDIGITAQDVQALLPDAPPPQPGAAMLAPISEQQGREWFGVAPPDLSLTTRIRATARHSGADYVYNYLRGFYRDPATRTGWNNTVAPGTAMPHVLAALQPTPATGPASSPMHAASAATAAGAGSAQGQLSPAEYDKTLADITHFMQWMAEPDRQKRQKTGWWVCLLFAAFAFAAWRLHASYWKDVQ